MTTSDPGQVAMWQEVLRLCNLNNSETVVLLVGEDSHPQNVAAASQAVPGMGARMLRLELVRNAPSQAMAGDRTAHWGPTALTGNRAATEAMKNADLVIDLMGIDRGTEQQEILDAGTRVLLVKEPPDILARIMPSLDDKRRTLAAASQLEAAKTMRATSEAGTDFEVELGDFPLLIEYGIAEDPGRWDHWPSGFLATWPNEGSANGTVVLDRGDIILPFKDYVRTPITLTIRDGYIREIEGEFDADYLRDYLATFDDPEGYAVSHLGWGLQPKAQWTALGMYDKRQTNAMDARSFYGNFMFSTGPNAEAGGNRHTPCHLDIPMRNCSVLLDSEPMVLKGEVVPDDQRTTTP